MDRDDQPDHTEDPHGRDTGAGYPEEQPAGAQPGVQRGDQSEDVESPSTSSGQEGDPKRATGNPGAAG